MSEVLRCVVVDDEFLARNLLKAYVEKIPGIELVKTCENALEALELIQKEPIDLLLLDIQMPDLTGLELLKTLTNKPFVIFTTAYAEYAIKGYELDVSDYLLKPISFERFIQAINKVRARWELKKQALQAQVQASSTSSKVQKEVEERSSKDVKDHFFVKDDYKHIKIYFKDILYIEGLREYVGIYTHEKRYVIYQALKRLEDNLPSKDFMRVHKSYIVSLSKMRGFYGNTIEIDDKEIPIGKSYKVAFLKRIETF